MPMLDFFSFPSKACCPLNLIEGNQVKTLGDPSEWGYTDGIFYQSERLREY